MHLHAHGLLQVGALHLLPLDAEPGEARVLAVARKVVQEVVDDWRRDDITDVLSVLVLQRLHHTPPLMVSGGIDARRYSVAMR